MHFLSLKKGQNFMLHKVVKMDLITMANRTIPLNSPPQRPRQRLNVNTANATTLPVRIRHTTKPLEKQDGGTTRGHPTLSPFSAVESSTEEANRKSEPIVVVLFFFHSVRCSSLCLHNKRAVCCWTTTLWMCAH